MLKGLNYKLWTRHLVQNKRIKWLIYAIIRAIIFDKTGDKNILQHT